MPRRCSVFGCHSNYDNEESYTFTFSLPKDSALRDQWIRNIPTDLTKIKNPIVCIKHFEELKIIRTDKVIYKGELKEYHRVRPKLIENAVPTIFPNCPSYLSVPVSKVRLPDVEDENLNKAISQSIESYKKYISDIMLTAHSDVIKHLQKKELPENVVHYFSNTNMYICVMDVDDESPYVLASVIIDNQLNIEVFSKRTKILPTFLPVKNSKLGTCNDLDSIVSYITGSSINESGCVFKSALDISKTTKQFEKHESVCFCVEQLTLCETQKHGCRQKEIAAWGQGEASQNSSTNIKVEVPDAGFGTAPDTNVAPESSGTVQDVNSTQNSRAAPNPGTCSATQDTTPKSPPRKPSTASIHRKLCGRRIVDIDYFLKALKVVSGHGIATGCSLKTIVLVERSDGLRSCFSLKCTGCRFKSLLWTEDPDDPEKNLNHDVAACMADLGYGIDEMLALLLKLQIPPPPHSFFSGEGGIATKFHEFSQGWCENVEQVPGTPDVQKSHAEAHSKVVAESVERGVLILEDQIKIEQESDVDEPTLPFEVAEVVTNGTTTTVGQEYAEMNGIVIKQEIESDIEDETLVTKSSAISDPNIKVTTKKVFINGEITSDVIPSYTFFKRNLNFLGSKSDSTAIVSEKPIETIEETAALETSKEAIERSDASQRWSTSDIVSHPVRTSITTGEKYDFLPWEVVMSQIAEVVTNETIASQEKTKLNRMLSKQKVGTGVHNEALAAESNARSSDQGMEITTDEEQNFINGEIKSGGIPGTSCAFENNMNILECKPGSSPIVSVEVMGTTEGRQVFEFVNVSDLTTDSLETSKKGNRKRKVSRHKVTPNAVTAACRKSITGKRNGSLLCKGTTNAVAGVSRTHASIHERNKANRCKSNRKPSDPIACVLRSKPESTSVVPCSVNVKKAVKVQKRRPELISEILEKRKKLDNVLDAEKVEGETCKTNISKYDRIKAYHGKHKSDAKKQTPPMTSAHADVESDVKAVIPETTVAVHGASGIFQYQVIPNVIAPIPATPIASDGRGGVFQLQVIPNAIAALPGTSAVVDAKSTVIAVVPTTSIAAVPTTSAAANISEVFQYQVASDAATSTAVQKAVDTSGPDSSFILPPREMPDQSTKKLAIVKNFQELVKAAKCKLNNIHGNENVKVMFKSDGTKIESEEVFQHLVKEGLFPDTELQVVESGKNLISSTGAVRTSEGTFAMIPRVKNLISSVAAVETSRDAITVIPHTENLISSITTVETSREAMTVIPHTTSSECINESIVTTSSTGQDARINEPGSNLNGFKIPWEKFPESFINDCNSKRKPNPVDRRKVVREVIAEVRNVNENPPRKFIEKIAAAMVNRYPESLEDCIGQIKHEHLFSQLENRLHHCNRGRKIQADVILDAIKTTKHKYGCLNWQPCSYPKGETHISLTEKKEWLKSQFQLSVENEEILNNMQLTFAIQRLEINNKSFNIGSYHEEWPYLFKKKYFLDHANTLMKLEIEKKWKDEMSVKLPKILNFFKSISFDKKHGEIKQILDSVEVINSETESCDAVECSMLLLLLKYFNEDENQLVKYFESTEAIDSVFDTLKTTEYPIIAVLGDNILENPLAIVSIQGVLIGEISKFSEQIVIAFIAFYTFNYPYPEAIEATLEFLQRYILNIEPIEGGHKRGGKRKRSSVHPLVRSLTTKISDLN